MGHKKDQAFKILVQFLQSKTLCCADAKENTAADHSWASEVPTCPSCEAYLLPSCSGGPHHTQTLFALHRPPLSLVAEALSFTPAHTLSWAPSKAFPD